MSESRRSSIAFTSLRRPSLMRTGSGSLRLTAKPLVAFQPMRFDIPLDTPAADGLLPRRQTPPMHIQLPQPMEPRQPRTQKLGKIFGIETRYKPLWLLAMGGTGNFLYGTGTTAIERAIWPRNPPPSDGTPLFNPHYVPLFGSNKASLSVGLFMTIVGASLALLSMGFFYQDSSRLAKRQNPARPAYLRPNIYAALHLVGISLSIASQFLKEGIRTTPLSTTSVWVSAIPGIIGSSLFSVTQAQAASGCEVLNGRMPLKNRAAVGFIARCGVAFYILHNVFMQIPNFNIYGREVVRLIAQTCTTVAYALPLTTARIGRSAGVNFQSHQPEPNWYAFNLLATYIVGRCLAGFGPDFIQHGVLGKPSARVLNSFGGATSLAVGTGMCMFALTLFRADIAAYQPKKANLMFAGITMALLFILVYTAAAQYSGATHMRSILWASLPFGLIGGGLRLALLPEFFAWSELRAGDLPLPQRYHWTEACRFLAGVAFGLWGVLSALPEISSFAREAVAVAAGAFATLGMALPTTTSRRAMPQYAWPLSPGATPPAVTDGFFSSYTFPPPSQVVQTPAPTPALDDQVSPFN